MAKLHQLDQNSMAILAGIPVTIASVKGLQSMVKGLAKANPGKGIPIGDPSEDAKKYVKEEGKKYADETKVIVIALATAAMAAYAAENPPDKPDVDVDKIINEINPMIDELNGIIKIIGGVVEDFMDFVESIKEPLAAILVIWLAAFIITMIPSVVAAFGAGVSFDMHKPFLAIVMKTAELVHKIMCNIATAVIAVILILLGIFAFISMIIGLISAFLSLLVGLLMACRSDNLKTADDWAATSTLSDDRDQMDRTKLKDGDLERRLEIMMQLNELEFTGNLVACTLPSGEVKQMTPDDCLAAGGTFGDLVACTLPDGSVQQMTPDDCLAAGGTFGDNRDDLLHELNNLGGPIDGVCLSGPECENLSYEECLNSPNCYWGGGELIITSLLHPDRDVTIEKATYLKGKRYGFYQKDIKQ